MDVKLLRSSGKNIHNKYVPFRNINGIPLCKTIVKSDFLKNFHASSNFHLPRLHEFDKETLEFDWLDIFLVTNQNQKENKQ